MIWKKATKIARSMIAQYGMSKKFGLMSLEQVENPYLGNRTTLNCSDKTATEIEEEVKILLKENTKKLRSFLEITVLSLTRLQNSYTKKKQSQAGNLWIFLNSAREKKLKRQKLLKHRIQKIMQMQKI